jgi:hypothetical protein
MNNPKISPKQTFAAPATFVGIYERTHPSHAWRFVRESNREAAELARDVSKGFGIETLIISPIQGSYPLFLGSYTVQN